ncbi:MAG: CDP-glycerol glycerophosphotransferase family protein [Candidatus Limnocylindria bacterium]
MTSQPGEPGARVPAIESALELSGLEITELHWERIQLVLRIERTPGGNADLHAGVLHLRLVGGDTPPLPSRPGGVGSVRFNVFVGHDQMPLDPGRWEVVLRRAGERNEWSAVPAAGQLIIPESVREFVSGGSTYRVSVGPVDPDRALAIDISTWVRTPLRLQGWSLRPLVSWLRGVRRRAWLRLFNLLISVLYRLPKRRPMIVFTSDSRVSLGGNLKLVHDRLVERGLDRTHRIAMILKPSIRARRTARDRIRLVWLFARARIIVLEDYQPAIYNLPRRREQQIIQLWHAWGAFKTVGYSRIGKPGGPSPYSRVHKNYTYATASSTHEVPFYAEAFGLPEERVVPTGAPSMDDFLDQSLQATRRQRAYEAVPAARDRTVILLAPTFRGGGARRAHYPVDLIDIDAAYALCEQRDATLLIRMHPFVRDRVEIPPEYRDRLVDASDLPVETNDLLLITDLLVTDYSSLVFEYSTLGRPMLFFAYDLTEYVATRDFYEPYESFVPGRIVRTFDELVDAIGREDHQVEKVAPFAARHMPAGEGSATDRIIDELILPS